MVEEKNIRRYGQREFDPYICLNDVLFYNMENRE